MYKIRQYEIIIAALLHDIGKFKQRAYGGDESKPNNFTKSIEGYILPVKLSHRHALWTYDFFENDLKYLDNLPKETNFTIIRDLASNHHNPSTADEEIISYSDRISASFDRIKEDENHYKRGDYLKKHLKPLFKIIF